MITGNKKMYYKLKVLTLKIKNNIQLWMMIRKKIKQKIKIQVRMNLQQV